MSYALVNEVRDFAPLKLTPAEYLILRHIADAAQDQDRPDVGGRLLPARQCFAGSDRLAWDLRMEPPAIQKALQRLAGRGLECRVKIGEDKNGKPVYAVPGRPRYFRLPDLESWAREHGQLPMPGRGGNKFPSNDEESGKGFPPNDENGGNRFLARREQVSGEVGTGSHQNHKEPEVNLPPTPQASNRRARVRELVRTGEERNLIAIVTGQGFGRDDAEAIVTYAKTDGKTHHSLHGRLKAPGETQRIHQEIQAEKKSARRRQLEAGPKCEDHPEQPAEICTSCAGDIKAGQRDARYRGKRQPEAKAS